MNTNKQARWKGAGMGEYYCSLCCEVGDVRERICSHCHASMYTDKEYAEAKAWWALEDSLDDILPDALMRCKYCDDEDMLHDIVCYLPTENGSSINIPIIHCPACGRKVTEE